MGKYIVFSKGDDYGHCRTELVETTLKNAKQYYHCIPVDVEDEEVLRKYLGLVHKYEEKERTSGERFYGAE